MSRGFRKANGQRQDEKRLPALTLSWLLFLVVSLAALSCTTAGGAGPAAVVAQATPEVQQETAAAPPTVASPLPLPSPSAPPTQAAAPPPDSTLEPAPGTAPAGETSAPASPLASPTVGTVAVACPPKILTGEAPVYGYRVIAAYPHDALAFTQGLVYTGGVLYEGTGLWNGLSSLRKVDLETGDVLEIRNLRTDEFGEGIAVHGGRILQLTWLNRVGYIYDRDSFAVLGSFSYPTEGWGLTHDGTRFIMSDGTATLHFWDLQTLAEIGQVQAHDENGPLVCLNELEYIDGQVYANVWQTDYVAVIDPATGAVTAWIHLAGLLASQGPALSADVLNGIAYDAEGDRLFVTGKYWPWLFEIELVGPLQRTLLPQVSG